MSSVKIIRIIGLALLLFIPIWIMVISPELTKLPNDFEYKLVLFSRDNFYDAEQKEFHGDFVSNTNYYYRAAAEYGEILLIKSGFSVQQPTGEEIFSVERTYGIDAKTRKHVPSYGDKDREGYLFAPPHLQKGQNFTYWHINYDYPADMKYRGEESIAGLSVYRYETDYHADQTFDLESIVPLLSGKGIDLDINLQLWIEPFTGSMIKYEDQTIAYFYNLTTKKRIHPWNKFHNTVDEISILKQVEIAKRERLKRFLVETIMTVLMIIVAIILLLYPLVTRKKK